MPVCSGCGASFEDSFQCCPYCGRSRPEPQKIEAQAAVIERDDRAACPNCRRSDQVKKASAIIASQTLQTIRAEKDADGGEASVSTSASELAQKLSVQLPRPTPPNTGRTASRMALILWLLAVIGALSALVEIISGHSPVGALLVTILFGVLAVRATNAADALRKNNAATREQYQVQLKEWEAVVKKQANLYYCERCDHVFLPGENASAPVDQIEEYLFTPSSASAR